MIYQIYLLLTFTIPKFGIIAPKHFIKLHVHVFRFLIFLFWAYLMKVMSETCRAHLILHLLFYYLYNKRHFFWGSYNNLDNILKEAQQWQILKHSYNKTSGNSTHIFQFEYNQTFSLYFIIPLEMNNSLIFNVVC